MRRLFPLLVVAIAILLYYGRETVLVPFRPARPDRSPAAEAPALVQTAAVQVPPAVPPAQVPAKAPASTILAETETVSVQEPDHRPVPPFKTNPPVITQGKIQRGSSFFVEMSRAGIPPNTIDQLVRASRKAFNLKRVHPGQKFTIFQSQTGDVDSLSMALKGDKILNLRRSGDAYVAAVDTIPYLVTYHITSGTIQQSVFATLQQEGANPDLAGRLALIYGWEVDFFTDIRRGDQFTILYENRTYDSGKVVLGRVLAARLHVQGHDHLAIGYKPAGESWSYFDGEGISLQKSLLRAPLTYSRITSNFSYRRLNPVTHHYAPHLGVDYGAPYGTPVKATGDGTVQAATRGSANGNYVKIKHNRSYTTYYLHLSRFAKGVRTGRKVKQGQIIGYVGSTGRSTGPHLCYRMKVGGRYVNPRNVKLPSKDPVPPAEIIRFQRIRDACLVKFLEGTHQGEDGQTILVEKPVIHSYDDRKAMFEN